MKHLIDSGAAAITLHLRYTDDRPRVPCHKELFPTILAAMKEYAPDVPICYNGDVFSDKDVKELRERYPGVGLMIGRGAILNMGVFSGKETKYEDSNRDFVRLSAQYNNCFANVKYTAFRVITEGNHQSTPEGTIVHNAHDWETLGSVYGIGEECISILKGLKEKGLEVDDNLTIENAGKHRKSKKRERKPSKSE